MSRVRRRSCARRDALTAVVGLLIAVGCGVPEGRPEPIPAAELPRSLQAPGPTSSSPSTSRGPAPLAVYWISDRRLVPESVTFGSPPDPERLVDLLEEGPGSTASGVRSAVSGRGVVAGVTFDEPHVAVEVSGAFDDLTASDQALAVAQLVATLTTVPEVADVSLRRDGEIVDVPLPDGTLVRRPLVRADYASLID